MGSRPCPSRPPPCRTSQGLEIEAVEWLPSGADSGLVRVRGRWSSPPRPSPGCRAAAARRWGATTASSRCPTRASSRDPPSWRGPYLVPSALVVAAIPRRCGSNGPAACAPACPALARGLESPPAAPRPSPPAEEPGGQVIDRAVLAERRARRAEAAEQAQARVAAEALRAVEALELQSAELERRLAEASAERDALAEGFAPPSRHPAGVRSRRARRALTRYGPPADDPRAPRRAPRGRARERARLAVPAPRPVPRLAARAAHGRDRPRRTTRSGSRCSRPSARSGADSPARRAARARTRELEAERARPTAGLEEVRAPARELARRGTR